MDEWKDMGSAPKDRNILVYGKPTDVEGVRFTLPGVHTAYWDELDSSYCIKGASWLGPFIKPLCWMEEPSAPALVAALTPPSPT